MAVLRRTRFTRFAWAAWPQGIHFFGVFAILSAPNFAADCSGHGNFDVANQQDIDGLSRCAAAGRILSGDVRFSAAAFGNLTLPGVGFIDGNIIIENNDLLESLHFASGLEGDQSNDGTETNLVLRNLSALTRVSSEDFTSSLTTLEMRGLPVLTTATLPSMLGGTKLGLYEAKNLREFSFSKTGRACGKVAKNIEIRDVGLESIDMFFCGGTARQSISVGGIPNVQRIRMGLVDASNVFIEGPPVVVEGRYKTLDLKLLTPDEIDPDTPPAESRITSLTVIGIGVFYMGDDKTLRPSVGTFTVRNTDLAWLAVPFADLENLVVHDNPYIMDMLHDERWSHFSWGNISIRNNSFWLPRPYYPSDNVDITERWIWPEVTLESFEYSGRITNDVLWHLVKRGKRALRLKKDPDPMPFVSRSFLIDSWDNSSGTGDPGFDCEDLNEFRRKGFFQGEYTCQGESVEIENYSGRMQPGERKLAAPLLASLLIAAAWMF